MVTTLLVIISTVGALVILGLIGWIGYLFTKGEVDEPERNTVINLDTSLSEGRALGKEISSEKAAGDRVLVTMMPTDISPKNKEEIKVITYPVARAHRLIFPKGTWSKEKNLIIDLPVDSTRFPEGWKNCPIGKLMQFYVEITNADNTELQALEEGLQRVRNLKIRRGEGELSVDHQEKNLEMIQDVVKMLKEIKGDKKPVDLTPPQNNSNS